MRFIAYDNVQFWLFVVGGSLFALAYGTVMPRGAPSAAPYQIALEVDPGFALGHYNAGVAAQAAGDLAGAHAHYQAALAAEPYDHTPCFNDAQVSLRLARLDDALASARCAVRFETDGASLDLLGQVLVARGEHAEAADVLERAIAARPEHAATRVEHATALAQLGRKPEAEQTLTRAVELRPDLAEAWFNLGLLAWERGDKAEAYRRVERAVTADPRNVKAMGNLAYLDIEANRAEPALRWLDRVLAIEPANERATRLRAEILRAIGRGP
jgi:tetratricopeptide (TPR) repeat protein